MGLKGWAVNIEISLSTKDTPLKCCQQFCQTAPFSVRVHVCVFECVRARQDLSTNHLTEQELKALGSFGTEVNLGCSTRNLFPAFSHSLPLFLSRSSLFSFLFHPVLFSITPSPLLSPSEWVASQQGVSKVLIGSMLANGGRLDIACWCELMLSPHSL